MAGYAIVFPGQGSQKPGMGRPFFEAGPEAKAVFDRVSSAIEFDVADLCLNGDEDVLRQTDNTQIALFATSMAAYEVLRERLPTHPIAMAGHSVGEYAALVASGVLGLEAGATLVRRRGELMAKVGSSRPGKMAAVLGLEHAQISEVCTGVSSDGHVVVIANSNCPGQTVISGDAAAVEEACEALKRAGAKRCLPLNVSGAFHSPLMDQAAAEMAKALAKVEFSKADMPVVSNVTARAGDNWADLLEQQLRSEVRWSDSISEMLSLGCDRFIECGSGEVLTGLLKRIDPEASGIAFNSPGVQVEPAGELV